VLSFFAIVPPSVGMIKLLWNEPAEWLKFLSSIPTQAWESTVFMVTGHQTYNSWVFNKMTNCDTFMPFKAWLCEFFYEIDYHPLINWNSDSLVHFPKPGGYCLDSPM